MIELSVSLASNGVVKVPGYEQLVRFGYTKNRGVYRLHVDATGEWEGLTIRCFWHVPGGSDPASSLVVNGYVDVPASVTAQTGSGCVTFEGSDGTKTVTSADLRYRVSANSGTEDGTEPEPGTPAWQQLVDAVHTDAATAEQAKTDAQTAASEAATSAGNANRSAEEAADSLQELKDGIASGDFKGEPGNDGKSPVVTVTDIENGHRVSITDKDGTKTIDVLNGQAGKDGTQIDDATVGLDAWSSKHIIDTLCPPLEETGNPVVCYPVASYPLGVKATWEPVQEGSGTPSPENIRPIKGRDSVAVTRCGENLLNIAPFTKETYKGITYEYVATGGVHISGTATAAVDSPIFAVGHLPPGKYYGLDIDTGVSASIVVRRNGANLWLNAKGAFEILAGDVIKYWYMIATNGATLDMTVYPYIVPGTTAPTTYTPYIGQTATLTLPRTIYGGTVDAVTGEGQETYVMRNLDGTELWGAFRIPNGQIRWYFNTETPLVEGSCLSNIYKSRTAGELYDGMDGVSAQDTYILVLDSRYGAATQENWKAYLAAQYAAGTPVQIAYKLATPTPFTATGAQPIPALSGVNTAVTDADSVTVTGRADPIKRITDLEDAVASMTTT